MTRIQLLSPRGSNIATRTVMRAECARCGAAFGPPGRQRFCGPVCRYASRDAARFTPKGTTLAGSCVECGAAFVYESRGGRRRVVCGPVCSRKRANRRRRAQ